MADAFLTYSTKTKVETYTYKIKSDALNISNRDVILTFENGEFKNCSFPFTGSYTRDHWKILAEIQKEIEKVITEKEYQMRNSF